jgi:hypothetical protein
MRGWIALGIVVAVAAVAFVVYNLIPKDSVSKASVSDAVVKFRKDIKKAADYPKHPWAKLPPFGVYRYSSRGSEAIDSFALSTAHNYGGVSTVTLTPTRCGAMERWQPLVQRWSEGYLCVAPHSTQVVGVRDFHEFFEKSKKVSYACTGGSTPYASGLRPGMTWTTTCSADKGTVISHVEVVGFDRVTVAGRPVDAVHLRATATLKGDPDGTDVRDSWIRRSDGLLLRRIDHSKAHVDAGGGSQFSEDYELDLLSTAPQR